MADATTDEPTFSLPRLQRVVFEVPIQGTSPLIVNRWSEKAKAMMLAAQQTKARPKPAQGPRRQLRGVRYRFEDGRDGFPATAFKAAIVHASRLFDGVTQVLVKQTVLVIGDGPDQLVPIEYGDITMREDTPQRFRCGRPSLPSAVLAVVDHPPGAYHRRSVRQRIHPRPGGRRRHRWCRGVAPHFPKSATGTYGTFEVAG